MASRRSGADTRVVIFSVHTAPSWVRAAFDAGACGYLTKSSVGEEIVFAVQEVLKGRFYVSPVVARAVLEHHSETSPAERSRPPGNPAPAAGERLTRREHDVVCLVGQGLGNKEIARRLGVAVTTVRTHLKRVYDKLGLSGRVGLALHAAPPSEIGALHRTSSPSR